MAWEAKGKLGKRYYYRCVRINGRPTKRYVGRGLAADMAARQDEQARIARLDKGAAIRADRLRHAHADQALRDLRSILQTLTEAALIGLGYYRHHRGEWRRRRGQER